MRVRKGRLTVGHESIRLTRYRRVFLIALGKASAEMMRAAVNALAGSPIGGILVTPKNQRIYGHDNRIKLFQAGHPLPDLGGFEAARAVSEALQEIRRDELLICLISGGASAMLPSPPPSVPLRDERTLMKLLIKSTATIHEINTVRRHISTLRGGRLVRKCQAKTILSLIISDVPGDSLPDIASGLTTEDPTTYADALATLKRHDLWASTPPTVRNYLRSGYLGKVEETPKPGTKGFSRVRNIIIANARTACSAAAESLSMDHVRAEVLTSRLEMHASTLGALFASIARDRREHGDLSLPGAVIVGGETTVHVKGHGIGGRNQEMVLSASKAIAGLRGVVVAALGTDGVDGNSRAAGAIADGCTLKRAEQKGLKPESFLVRNDSYRFFRALNDNLITGATGTNVGDVYLTIKV
jgi:hydroxypyruvate reductase